MKDKHSFFICLMPHLDFWTKQNFLIHSFIQVFRQIWEVVIQKWNTVKNVEFWIVDQYFFQYKKFWKIRKIVKIAFLLKKIQKIGDTKSVTILRWNPTNYYTVNNAGKSSLYYLLLFRFLWYDFTKKWKICKGPKAVENFECI